MKKIKNVKYVFLLVLISFLLGCPPYAVTILTPYNGTNYEAGVGITFTGTAMDLTDGELSGNSLVWTSSIDGEIGTGAAVT